MRVTVITAVKNAAATLPDALASMRFQQRAGIEIEHLILDGASTDGSLAVAEAYAAACAASVVAGRGPSSVQVRSQADRGLYDALNQGIAMASGDVVGILHADDYFPREDLLARVGAALAAPGAPPCLYGDLLYVRPAGAVAAGPAGAPRPAGLRQAADGVWWLAGATPYRHWRSGPCRPSRFYGGWMPPHPTVFLRRDRLQSLGGYRLDLGAAADYEFLLRVLLKNRVPAQYWPVVMVHMRTGGMSGGGVRRRWAANRMDRLAWAINGLRPAPWTLLFKVLRKLPQFITPCLGHFSNRTSNM